ncbi:DNA repair protein RecN [Vibrio sp. SS-MA-C1-2]|uniref:DNA repair protein RecN n=1 Tax=Vibrio sp. SS-MA-C1-2 TaxID=2908646 RepID=UPI001F25AE96|nr:DNA repair protein RecN [Vibrio sp. SS-MA-C1-2]UJF19002.1 DNA repair protein RecN [Vibrio sp. SS-MA-C1-2]
MLTNLTISNFAIVKSLDLELNNGMTTITGETGAGKSIAIDALGLCLGDRCESSVVRPNEDKAELTASFSLKDNLTARNWLIENDLADGDECLLRRIVTKEGRSRGYINGSPVPASQLKILGQQLINIHGQHAHQQLMKKEYQLSMLDQYAGHHQLLNRCRKEYQLWRQIKNELKKRQQNREENEAQRQLISYQVIELNELGLIDGEYQELESEHILLSNSGQLVSLTQTLLNVLYESEEENALGLLQRATNHLGELNELDSSTEEFNTMVNDAVIQIEEVGQNLQRYFNNIELDPERLSYVEERIGKVMSLARKHQVQPVELFQHHQDLSQQLESLDNGDEALDELKENLETQWASYLKCAEKLTKSRRRYATELNEYISASMHDLSMENGQFNIEITSDPEHHATPLGIDLIEFQVSTNPGQPLQCLAKVASGGELSRISLAIQVITAQKVETPSLIFDEVDVGISGPTAAVVGRMLRTLGKSTQVICVTHLPQVAGSGHQQLFVAKKSDNKSTETTMNLLTEKARVKELARLLAGDKITETTLANAKELLVAA